MITEIMVDTQHIIWLPWIVNYFFFIGLSFCSIFIAILLFAKFRENQTACELVAVSIAFITSIVAPIALTADLHQPSRVLHFYMGFAWWSWMAWGAIFLPWFSASVAGYFLFLLAKHVKKEHSPTWLHWLSRPLFQNKLLLNLFRLSALLSAMCIFIYTVMEVYNTGTRALWHTYWLFLIILCSVLPAAIMLIKMLMEQLVKQRIPTEIEFMGKISLVLFMGACVGIYFYSDSTQLDALQLIKNSPVTFYAVVVLGIVTLLTSFYDRLNLLTLLSALLFAWFTRWVLLIQVQTIPKTNAVQNYYSIEWGDVDGGLGILAILGLCLFVSVVVWQLLTFILGNRGGTSYE